KIERHFYDLNWEPLNYTDIKQKQSLKKPKLFDEMICVSEILSEDFPFVRVDLYEIKDQIVFGELTFTPSSGMATYFTEAAQQEIGNMLELPADKKVGFK
ncbi:ATP-grasp fold amidoligase family protein, partial [Tetragenococcus koreensis]|uniref:ATP-grasp fold amidoligase family protein n=1 Tax=Tetragenococcus koreensis TaxID=290335 RepID=UPI002277B65C